MAKVDKYSIYGLKRRPTYEEIIGVIDESNEKSQANYLIGRQQCLETVRKALILMGQMLWNN